MGQNGHGQNSDGGIRVCTSSLALRRANSPYSSSNAWALLICVQCILPGAFVFVFTGGDFLRIGLIYLEFRVSCTFCSTVSLPSVLFSG